ncbi:MAG: enoyl-CoA hydratase/isomerase family protein, partial [Dehalococcoidales bacterium]|nr:enoyl-CoA hydratase/isomerase family protein [Dehalococcoidales bacterium]
MTKKPRYFMVDQDGKVTVWKFYNPPNNIWNTAVHLEFNDLVEQFYEDPNSQVGVIASAMPDVFILHFDVATLVEMGHELEQTGVCPNLEAISKPRGVYRVGPKVTIAAINANLSGGGLEMAMACDFRFMAKNASASQSEVNVGILPG